MRFSLAAAVLALVACSEPAAPSHLGPAFTVQDTVFHLDSLSWGVAVTVPYRLYNQSGRTLYIDRCLLGVGALLERESATGWVSAWSPPYACALSAPVPFAAGDSLVGQLEVTGASSPNAGPHFDIPTDTVWRYRLRIPMYAHAHGFDPPTAELPADSQTVSIPFRIMP